MGRPVYSTPVRFTRQSIEQTGSDPRQLVEWTRSSKYFGKHLIWWCHFKWKINCRDFRRSDEESSAWLIGCRESHPVNCAFSILVYSHSPSLISARLHKTIQWSDTQCLGTSMDCRHTTVTQKWAKFLSEKDSDEMSLERWGTQWSEKVTCREDGGRRESYFSPAWLWNMITI